ncbi:MAG: hypothetical protein MPN21_10460 [Thermoanaerobaculia bacterium]|nr:hypothetical protein [Thermoanaerobaculia bacterium]
MWREIVVEHPCQREKNWEVLVKVLDGCGLNDRYWIFTAAATNVEYAITVFDTVSEQEWTYDNSLGVASPAVTDIDAFACQP